MSQPISPTPNRPDESRPSILPSGIWAERLVLHPSASGTGVYVALEREIPCDRILAGQTGTMWIFLTGFTLSAMYITSRELWEQAWIHTGKREYGERVPEQ